jgi:hypothetical protein
MADENRNQQTESAPQDKSQEDKLSVTATLKHDLLGVDDWKTSKVGFLTGFAAFRRMGGSMGSNISESMSRTSGLFNSVRNNGNNIPELPQHLAGLDPKKRFIAAAKLHGHGHEEIQALINTTYRSFYLYLGIGVFGLSYVAVDLIVRPQSDLLGVIARFAVIALSFLLAFRASHTNYIGRQRALVKPMEFIRAKDYLPSRADNKKPRS